METRDNFILVFLIVISIALTITSLYIQHFYLTYLPIDPTTQFMDHINFFTSTFGILAIITTIGTCIVLVVKYV